jgi:hypothetical protein
VEELVEEVEEKVSKKMTETSVSLHERLLTEATANLEKKRQLQLTATKEKTVDELLKDAVDTEKVDKLPQVPESIVAVEGLPVEKPKPRTRR